jgi:hypothetical protein
MRLSLFVVTLSFGLMTFALAGLAADLSIDATYTVGNLDAITAGTDGRITLKENTLVFSDGKNVVFAPYSNITSAEMGAKVPPPAASGLKKIKFKKDPVRRLMIVEYADVEKKDEKGHGVARTMTFDVEEVAGEDFVTTIEERAGRRKHSSSSDNWWGDSAWKTKTNGNAVRPDSLGKLDK